MTNTSKALADSDLLQWTPAKYKIMRNLAQLVQFFQTEYSGGMGTSAKSLILPSTIMPYCESANTDDVPDDVIATAQAPIVYYDDVPCISGVPVYERLEGEPIPYYKVFQVYRDMKTTNSRRSLAKVHEITGLDMGILNLLNRTYHWQYRVVPFDEQLAHERAWKRQKAAEQVDGLLSTQGKNMLELAFSYLENHEEQLDPKTAIELIKIITPITRVATGLPKEAPEEAGFGRTSGGGGGTVVNVNTNQQVASGPQGVHGMSASEVEKKTEQQAEDPMHLASILNVLNQSGAFERQILEEQGALEAKFEEVSE